MQLSSYDGLIYILRDFDWGKKHRAITKGNPTGATNDIRNYESTDATNKYVIHDLINDSTTELTNDTYT